MQKFVLAGPKFASFNGIFLSKVLLCLNDFPSARNEMLTGLRSLWSALRIESSVGSSYMIPIVYRDIDSCSVSRLIVYRGTCLTWVSWVSVKEDCMQAKKACKGGASLRKLPTFRHATNGFPAKWRLRNERRNFILMTRHYPDPAIASDWLKQIFHAARPIRS